MWTAANNTFDTTLTFDATGTLTGGTSPITGIPNTTTCSGDRDGDGRGELDDLCPRWRHAGGSAHGHHHLGYAVHGGGHQRL